MINQNVLAIGAVAVVLIGLLGAANVYMVKPAMEPTLPAVEVLPAAAGRPLFRVIVTVWPCVTIRVGPGTCIVLQNPVVIAAGA